MASTIVFEIWRALIQLKDKQGTMVTSVVHTD